MDKNPYGYIDDQKVFRKGFQNYPDREIGVVKENDQKSFQYFVQRFSIIEGKASDIERQIKESKNKGSFLVKLVHIKDTLPKFDAIGNFEGLHSRLENLETYLKDLIDKNRLKNLEIKNTLILELEKQQYLTDFKESSEQVREIRNKWIQTGEVVNKERENIEARYQELVSDFYKRRNQYNEDQQKIVEEISVRYKEFLTGAEKILENNQPVKNFKKFKELRNEWKSLGKLPSLKYNQYLDKFKNLNEKAYQDYNQDRKNRRKKTNEIQREGLERRKVILNDARDLLHQPIDKAYPESRKLLEIWKNIRLANAREQSALSKDFYSICNRIAELNFLEDLSTKKNKRFGKLSEREQLSIKIKILSDLIIRDKNDLQKFYENKGIIRSGTDAFKLLIESKINQQENKIELKESILLELNELSRGNSDI